jgi:TPR repeat protein
MYLYGLGVASDYSQALYWLSLAADDRHPPALRQLATMYLSGKGVTLSLDAGIRYLEQASELGDKESIELLNKISSGDVEIQSNDPNTDTAAVSVVK